VPTAAEELVTIVAMQGSQELADLKRNEEEERKKRRKKKAQQQAMNAED
jgi:hypothetical protein